MLENAVAESIAHAERSVVAIARVKRPDRDDLAPLEPRVDLFGAIYIRRMPEPTDPEFIPNEFGTGVVIDRRGLILTCYHMLGEDSDLYVTTVDRKVYLARVKAADPRSDLAVLSIDATDLEPIKMGDAEQLRKGMFVIALGNPYAIARDGQASASWGIISNLERKTPPTPDDSNSVGKNTLQQYRTLIQTDARLNMGTSGGALLNLKGEMIGLTTALAALSGYEQSAGFAVPVDATFRRIVDTLKLGREVEYGFLGVRPESLPEAEILAGRHGVVVIEVVPGTPAQQFGLHKNDVITHVDGRPIYEPDGLVLHVGKLPVESLVELTVERTTAERVRRVLPIKVGLTKFAVRGKKIITERPASWRGVRVDYASTDRDFRERVNNGQIDPRGCVLVSEVEPNSPAWAAGLRPDMVICEVAGTRVGTPREFYAATADSPGPLKVRTIVTSADRPLFTVAPPAPAAEPAAH